MILTAPNQSRHRLKIVTYGGSNPYEMATSVGTNATVEIEGDPTLVHYMTLDGGGNVVDEFLYDGEWRAMGAAERKELENARTPKNKRSARSPRSVTQRRKPDVRRDKTAEGVSPLAFRARSDDDTSV